MTAFMDRPDRNISLCTETGKQRVKIIRDGKQHEIGRFDTVEEARAARDAFPDRRKCALQARAARVAQLAAREAGDPYAEPVHSNTDVFDAVQAICHDYLDHPETRALQASIDERLYTMLQTVVRGGHPIELACKVMGMPPKVLQSLTSRVLAARNTAT